MIRLLAFLFMLLVSLPARADCSRLRDLAMRAEGSDAAYTLAVGQWGLCAEKDSHFAEAHRLVSRALEAAPSETTAAGKTAPWPALRAALRRLDDRVARVLVMFDGDLWIDGHAMLAVSGAVLAVDPGRHLFEQRGKAPGAKEVEARAGDLPTVDLRSLDAAKAPEKTSQIGTAKAPKTAPLDAPLPSPFAPALTPRGVAVTVAYGALVTSVVSGIVAGVLEAQRSALAARLAPGACVDPSTPGCAELRLAFDQRTGARNVALVAGGVAVLAGGVGVTLHLTTNTADKPSGVATVQWTW